MPPITGANRTTDYRADQDSRQRLYQVKSATVINPGTIVLEDPANPGYIIPASAFPFQSLTLSAIPAALAFKGIALGKSAAGETDDILVAEEGVVTLNIASASGLVVGDYVGIDDNATPDAFEDNQVVKVTDPLAAIGRVVKKGTTSGTMIQICFGQHDDREFMLTAVVNSTDAVKVFEEDCPFKVRVIDFHIVCTDGVAGTIKLTNGTDDITNALTHGETDKGVVRVGTIDDAKHEISQGGKLYVVPATGGKSIAYIRLLRV